MMPRATDSDSLPVISQTKPLSSASRQLSCSPAGGATRADSPPWTHTVDPASAVAAVSVVGEKRKPSPLPEQSEPKVQHVDTPDFSHVLPSEGSRPATIIGLEQLEVRTLYIHVCLCICSLGVTLRSSRKAPG